MKKLLLLFAVLLSTVSGWAQKLVTTIQEGRYYTLECKSEDLHQTTRFLGENVYYGLNGQSAKPTYWIFEPADGGYYVKSSLTGKYLNKGESLDNDTYDVAYGTDKLTVWTIGKLADDATDIYLTIGDSKLYLDNSSDNAQKLQIVKHDAIGTGNACSLWEMREHEDGYKVIESIGDNITDLNQLTDGSYVVFYNAGRQKYIYEGLDYKLRMGTEASVDAGHEYIFRVRKEGEKYAFMAVSGRYISTPLDGNDVFTFGIENPAKDEFAISKDGEKWKLKSTNANIWWDAQSDRFVGWTGSGANSLYEIKPVNLKNLEHDLAQYITTDENIIKWVNIKNERCDKYATYEGESAKMSLKEDASMSKAFFYMTGTLSSDANATVKATLKIHNFATELLCAETNSWGTPGTNWNIMASAGENKHPGWAIIKGTNLGDNKLSWNDEGGSGNTIAYWNGNDQGSTWAFTLANCPALLQRLNDLKVAVLSPAIANAQSAYEAGEYTKTAVALTVEKLYCNAPYTAQNNGDNLGVGALIDGNDNTYLHTDYSGANSADNLDHYIRVDLGESSTIKYFTFNYKTRHDADGNNPRVIVVEGCDTENGEYSEIATLTESDGLPITGSGAEYESPALGGHVYRYIRFRVTDTNNHSEKGGHKFFSLASFGISEVTVKEGSEVKTLVYYNLSEAIAEAETVLATLKTTEDEINRVATNLNTGISGLVVQNYPFTLTTDVNHPVCYHIKSGRSKNWPSEGNFYWTFIDGKITTITADPNYKKDVEAYWFFMENPKTGQLQLVPFIEHTKPMGYTTVSDAADKITNNVSTPGFVGTDYTLVTNTTDTWNDYPYALKPYGGNTYVSNNGGKAQKYMGFYSTLADGGTRFLLEEADITPSAKLRDLRAALAPCPDIDDSNARDELGYYNVEKYNEYKAIVDPARATYEDATLTDDQYQEKIASLSTDPTTLLEINLPETERFYRFSHDFGNNGGNLYVQAKASNVATKENAMLMSAENGASSIFYYADEKLLSYSEGLYVNEGGNTRGLQSIGSTAGDASFEPGTVIGQLGVFSGNSFHANTSGEVRFVDHCGTVHSADHNFTVEPVTSLPFTFKAAALGYATFNAPVAVRLPDGVNAYIGEIVGGNKLKMRQFTGKVVPAETPVLLYKSGVAADTEVSLTIVEDITLDGVSDKNNFVGTIAAVNLDNTKNCYSLQKGTTGESAGMMGFIKKTDGTKAGFKAWIETTANTPNPARSFTIIFDGDNATGLKEALGLENENVEIYDLSGRRLDKPAKGVNVIGGKLVVK